MSHIYCQQHIIEAENTENNFFLPPYILNFGIWKLQINIFSISKTDFNELRYLQQAFSIYLKYMLAWKKQQRYVI